MRKRQWHLDGSGERIQRREFLALGGLSILAAASGSVQAKEANLAPRKPNIIFILGDDLGYGHLGCYGQKKILTPNIDQLAVEGMKFTNAYSGGTVCAPSRSVLMTGLHTGHTPIRANGGGNTLADEDFTVVELLKQAGYATGGFGKWGLGLGDAPGRPNRKGFEEFVGYLHQVHAHFYYPYFLWHNREKLMLSENEGRKRGRYSHDVIVEYAMKFIRENRDRPFFCYLPVTIPHVELVVPEDSEKPYHGKFPRISIPDPRKGYIGSEDAYVTFAGMISRLDRDVGRIMALLKDLNMDEQTVVFFTSDNGAQGGPWQPLINFFDGTGSLRGQKGNFYEGGIRVPLIARWPGHIARGSVSKHACHFADMMPTLAELAQVNPPKRSDGISFVPTLRGKEDQQKMHEILYWEMSAQRAARMGDWKLVQPKRVSPPELYNLATDAGETNNVAKDHPKVVERMMSLMDAAHTPPRPMDNGKPVGINDFVR